MPKNSNDLAIIDSLKLSISFHALKGRTLGIDENTVMRTTSGQACQKSFENTGSEKFTTANLCRLAGSDKPQLNVLIQAEPLL